MKFFDDFGAGVIEESNEAVFAASDNELRFLSEFYLVGLD